MNAPTKRNLIDSLRSPVCPACAREKKPRQSFCGVCFTSLPIRVKRDLYQLIGNGYEDAFAEALAHLGVTVPVWPEDDEIEGVGTQFVGALRVTTTITDRASSALDYLSERISGVADRLSQHAAAMGRWADDGGPA